jgi:flagellar biosynthesis protein FlhF
MQQFEPFNYTSIILTKLDETVHIGNILSVIYQRQKPISFLTNGQGVPQDIEKAEPKSILRYLEGFSSLPEEVYSPTQSA